MCSLSVLVLVLVVSFFVGLGEEQKREWFFIFVVVVKLLEVKKFGWVSNEIDRFILSSLEVKGLFLVEEAVFWILVWCFYFDFFGLFLELGVVEVFVVDKDSRVFSKLVDCFFFDKCYGECWARFWFDLV